MQNKPYPIGTKLATSRLSQFTLFMELFPNAKFKVRSPMRINGDDWRYPEPGAYCLNEEEFQVTVTPENQAYLSQVPIVGDWCSTYCGEYGSVTNVKIEPVNKDIFLRFESENLYGGLLDLILLRTFPNGQRAPLIEWDEVAEP